MKWVNTMFISVIMDFIARFNVRGINWIKARECERNISAF